MSLNGWQRLWVVVTILWSLVVGMVTWASWPSRDRDYLSVFGSGAVDPNSGTMPELDYEYALAHLDRWTKWQGGPKPVWKDDPFVAYRDSKGWRALIEIPGVGTVRFPSSMSDDEVTVAAKTIYDQHQNVLQRIKQENLKEFVARRRDSMRATAAAWLVPPFALYGLGWAAAWVKRGFAANQR